MSDFEQALQAKLARNAELEVERSKAEAEMDRVKAEEEARQVAHEQSKRDRHTELSDTIKDLADRLKATRPDAFIVRSGWTESGEEFVVKITTRQMTPKRSLFVEVDRDDDEVLARWVSDIGTSIEIWRLLEVTTDTLTQLVLQVADDEAWTGDRPPSFPG